jgi:hypothetical protein
LFEGDWEGEAILSEEVSDGVFDTICAFTNVTGDDEGAAVLISAVVGALAERVELEVELNVGFTEGAVVGTFDEGDNDGAAAGVNAITRASVEVAELRVEGASVGVVLPSTCVAGMVPNTAERVLHMSAV